MPAGGDNKPKLEKTINKAIAGLVKIDDKCGSLNVVLATILFIGSFMFGSLFAIPPHVDFAVLIPTVILFLASGYYLWRKI